MMGKAVLRSILEDIRDNSGFFGLIADESRDISNKEQLTCILRWVSLSDLTTHEDFIGMYLIDKPDAETVAASLKDILLRCSLDLDDCFWQGYDGAATMSGHLSGVAARLQNENPIAFRIRCAKHRLDLALKGCANESKIISDTLSFVQDLAVFIRHSPLRMSTYESIASNCESLGDSEHVQSLHLLCPTRWTVRTKAILAVLKSYEALYDTLPSISKTASTRESRDKSEGLATKMTKFTTFFGVHFAVNIFSVSEQLSISMQTKGILAQTAMEGVQALKENLQQQRNDYGVFFEQISEKAAVLSMVKEPVIPRPHKVPHRLRHGDAEQHHFESEKYMFRAQYFEAIDACLSELNRRFDEESYALLRQIEIAFLNAANQDRIEVVHLIQIYLLAPISAASAERSFSVQRQIKSYLRNTMSEKRYSNLLVLNIHKEKTDNIDLIKLAREFALKNDRRLRYFGKF